MKLWFSVVKALSDDTAEYHTAKSNLDFPQHVSTGKTINLIIIQSK